MEQVGAVCSFSVVNLLTIMHVMNNIKCAKIALHLSAFHLLLAVSFQCTSWQDVKNLKKD